MSITLRQLEAFLVVARTCHFGRAADELHVSQPVVSKEVARLERALGVDLFDRSTRTVRPTAAGGALMADAAEVCAAVEVFRTRARGLTAERTRTLRLATTPSVIDMILPIIIRRAERELPDVLVQEVAVETGEIPVALTERECDLGLGRFVDPPRGYQARKIRDEPVYVALSAAHPLAGNDSVRLADLGDLPLLLWPRQQNPAYYDRLMAICAQRSLAPLLLVSPPRVVGARSYLIADNRAFGLVPESTASTLPAEIAARPLAEPATLPLSLVWLARDPRPFVGDLVTLITQIAAELDTR